MRKLIYIILLLFIATPLFGQSTVIVAKKKAAACSSSTDGVLVASAFEATSANSTATWSCSRLTTTATWDVTGVSVGFCDSGSDAGNFVVGIYAHDATYNEPDADGTPIATKTIAASAVTNCGGSDTSHEVIFDTLVTDIGATTVWVCVSESSSSMSRAFDNVGARICYSSAETPTNNSDWTCFNTNTYKDSILGCE